MEILLARDKISLKEDEKKLYGHNQRISHEANNLKKAAKRKFKNTRMLERIGFGKNNRRIWCYGRKIICKSIIA